MDYDKLTDQQLYEYYLSLEEIGKQNQSEAVIREQEKIEKIPRFIAYVEDRDYTVWRRTQPFDKEAFEEWCRRDGEKELG